MFSATFERRSPCSFVSAWNSNRVRKHGANAKQYPQMKSAGTKHLQRNVISCLSVTFSTILSPPFFFFKTVQPCAVARGLRPVGRAGMKSRWRNPPLQQWIYKIYIEQSFIVLDHQLILCSQEGVCHTLSTLSAADAYCPPVVVERITTR